MLISAGKMVGIEFSIQLADGKSIHRTQGEPMQYLHGANQLVPGLERGLEGLTEGEERTVVVLPEDGFGRVDPSGWVNVPLSVLPNGVTLSVGSPINLLGPDGKTVPVVIREIQKDDMVVDLNHPLAGKTLHFEVRVTSIRDATPEELAGSAR